MEKNISLVTFQIERLLEMLDHPENWGRAEYFPDPGEGIAASHYFNRDVTSWSLVANANGVDFPRKDFLAILREEEFLFKGESMNLKPGFCYIGPTPGFAARFPWAANLLISAYIPLLRESVEEVIPGDYVYLYPDERHDVAGVGVPPQMMEQAGNRVRVEECVTTLKRHLPAVVVSNPDGWKFTYTLNWISYSSHGAEGQNKGRNKAENPKENRKDKIEALFKKAVKDHTQYHKRRFNASDGTQRASYAVICEQSGKGSALELREHFLDVCHARIRTEHRVFGLVDFIQMHIERGKMKLPFYKDDADYVNKFTEFFDYWVNRGPFARVFETKNMFDALEYGVRYDVFNNSCSAVAAAAVGLRSMGEFRETPYAFSELKKRFPENVACVLAMLSSYDTADAEWGFGFRGWHDILCSGLDVEVFEAFENPDLMPVFKDGQPSYHEAPHRYQIYEGIGFKENGSLMPALNVGLFSQFEDLVEAVCKKDKIKEQML